MPAPGRRFNCQCGLSACRFGPPRPSLPLQHLDLRDFDAARGCLENIPPESWPSPHPTDRAFSKLRLFVYKSLFGTSSEIFRAAVALMQANRMYGRSRHCMLRSCDVGWGGIANLRQFTPDVPILIRLLQVATIVDDPAEADGFLVPVPLGTFQAANWHMKAKGRLFRELRALLGAELVHLNESTSRRHIFLQTVDSCMTGLGELQKTPWLPFDSVVMHLGDDKWYSGNVQRTGFPMKRGVRFNNSIVVPYRAVLPPRLPRSPAEAAADDRGLRPLLLYGAFAASRHPLRSQLARSVTAAALAAGVSARVRVGEVGEVKLTADVTDAPAGGAGHLHGPISPPRRDGTSLVSASALAANATFCLCPSGDAPAFTQRLFTTLAMGCLPVFVDLYNRYPAEPAGPAFPFPRSIDWRRWAAPG